MKNILKKHLAELLRAEAGAIATMTALLLTVFLGFTALVVDIGRLALVKTQMQRAADAGALAGARALAPYPTHDGIVGTILWDQVIPDSGAKSLSQTIVKNPVDGLALTSWTVEAGFWDLTNKTMLPYTSTTLTDAEIPAVRVTINKNGSSNGGPVNFFFGSLMGKDSSDLTVKSLAALPGGPSVAEEGAAFPFAVPETWVKNNWDNPNQPTIIGSVYNPASKDWEPSEQGQWTSLLVDNNDVTTIRELMNNGNPTEIKVGDNIYIQPGAKASLYGDAGNFIGKVVLIPVVKDDFLTHSFTPIKGFVAFYIEATSQSQKWIKGHFMKNYIAPGTKTITTAPYYGTWAGSPKLIQNVDYN